LLVFFTLAERTTKFGKVNTFSYLKKPTLLNVISAIPESGGIRGIAVAGYKLYFVQHGPQVHVYNTISFAFIRSITISGAKDLTSILACPWYNCLYISDTTVVHRYNLSNDVTTKWRAGGQSYGLSLSRTYNVHVTLLDTKEIKEYTTDGLLVGRLSLDRSMEYPWKSVTLSNGDYVVSHGNAASLQRVCFIDTSGGVIQSYGGS